MSGSSTKKRPCILILGGARSGKSRFAIEVATDLGGSVLFVATAEAFDQDMRERIEEHRRTRPSDWRTLEVPMRVGKAVNRRIGGADTVVLDCLTLLVSNVLLSCGGPEDLDVGEAEAKISTEIEELIECIDAADAGFVLVSNEVGLGLVPDNQLGRVYRDLLGWTNQKLAGRADKVYFMAAGLPMIVKGNESL